MDLNGLNAQQLDRLRDAAELKHFVDGEYIPSINQKFPKYKWDLPIIAEDYCYVMDIMFIRDLSIESVDEINKRKSMGLRIWIEDNDPNNAGHNGRAPPWTCALVIVETTSRKAWAYPMHSKNSREVLYNFKKFLVDIDMRISRLLSDSGREYNMIKDFNESFIAQTGDGSALFHYFQVNASQNMHTTLSRVDRFIRTLRKLLSDYYTHTENSNWVIMLKQLVNHYNETLNSNLFLNSGPRKKRYYYSPNQVYSNPYLRRRIKIKDYLKKSRNYLHLERLVVGREVFYRILAGKLRQLGDRGYISQYLAIIREKIGNSFKIQLKTSRDIDDDKAAHNTSHYTGPEIIVPARDLLLKDEVRRGNEIRSRYNILGLLNQGRAAIDARRAIPPAPPLPGAVIAAPAPPPHRPPSPPPRAPSPSPPPRAPSPSSSPPSRAASPSVALPRSRDMRLVHDNLNNHHLTPASFTRQHRAPERFRTSQYRRNN